MVTPAGLGPPWSSWFVDLHFVWDWSDLVQAESLQGYGSRTRQEIPHTAGCKARAWIVALYHWSDIGQTVSGRVVCGWSSRECVVHAWVRSAACGFAFRTAVKMKRVGLQTEKRLFWMRSTCFGVNFTLSQYERCKVTRQSLNAVANRDNIIHREAASLDAESLWSLARRSCRLRFIILRCIQFIHSCNYISSLSSLNVQLL